MIWYVGAFVMAMVLAVYWARELRARRRRSELEEAMNRIAAKMGEQLVPAFKQITVAMGQLAEACKPLTEVLKR